jgi:hypothetical protein
MVEITEDEPYLHPFAVALPTAVMWFISLTFSLRANYLRLGTLASMSYYPWEIAGVQ